MSYRENNKEPFAFGFTLFLAICIGLAAAMVMFA